MNKENSALKLLDEIILYYLKYKLLCQIYRSYIISKILDISIENYRLLLLSITFDCNHGNATN